MRYQYISYILLISFITSPFLVSAIDTRNSARILDSFKKEEQDILFETLPFDNSGSNDLLEHEYIMSGLDGLRARLAAMQETYSLKKSFMTERRTNLEEAISVLSGAIDATMQDIEKTQTDISKKEENIQQYTLASLDLKRKIEKNRQTILSYLANIYSESNMIFDSSNSVDMLQGLILSSEDTDAIVTDITYKSLVSIL